LTYVPLYNWKPMLRIIYYSPELGYNTKDSASHIEILELEQNLVDKDVEVICIIDLATNYIFNRSSDFLAHMDKVDGRFFDWDYTFK
jgi:hypothetical protein